MALGHNTINQRGVSWYALLATASVAAMAIAAPAYATIDNTATVTGTPPTGPNVTDTSNTVQVPVAAPDPQLVVSKSVTSLVDAVDVGVYDAGDTITYSISIQNTGNVTMYNVAPVETGGGGSGITFNGVAGTGTFGAYTPATATIAPGATQVYSVTYTITDADAYRAAGVTDGVDNTASATGNVATAGGALIDQGADVTESTVESTLPATPRIEVNKTYALSKGGGNSATDAEEGDTLTYSYTVLNTGNTTLTAVQISDSHEPTRPHASTITPPIITDDTLVTDGPVGTSSDASTDGVWDTMVAGATVTFAYTHVVTQAEFDDQ